MENSPTNLCTKCKIDKNRSDFHKEKKSKSGLHTWCKSCVKKHKAITKDKIIARQKEWYLENREERSTISKQYDKDNPGLRAANAARRRAAKIKRTPNWLTSEDHILINDFYIEAARLTKETGVQYDVDHIVPLRGKIVSGLHCPTNLQIITKKENCHKGNGF